MKTEGKHTSIQGPQLALILLLSLILWHQPAKAKESFTSSVKHPEWSRNLSIYEVNLRQYTPEGTFKAFEHHLPRLKELGIGILWFMPIHPIGEQNRKGTLGSYYSVRDYLAVNPEFGTMEDFKALVKRAHNLGMVVILDWVANHTAWDNPLAREHPEWYARDSTGQFVPPVPDWHDVIDLNYDNLELREYMIRAMKFWVTEADVDGFRCDVAGMVPMEFWNKARAELEKIKPVFMLAEDESPAFHERAFDMSYGWELNRLMSDIVNGKKAAADLRAYFEKNAKNYPRDSYRMYFTSNHDENSWNGTEFERLKDAARSFAVLVSTIPGMPLIYSGQEIGLNKRLRFFDKDTIEWHDSDFTRFYETLLSLKTSNEALWNGDAGGDMRIVPTSNDSCCFAFQRIKGDKQVFVLLNLLNADQSITLNNKLPTGDFKDIFSSEKISFSPNATLQMKPWEYRVFER